jgi:hypothetical protein
MYRDPVSYRGTLGVPYSDLGTGNTESAGAHSGHWRGTSSDLPDSSFVGPSGLLWDTISKQFPPMSTRELVARWHPEDVWASDV